MGTSIPEHMKTKTAMAINQDTLSKERTELSIIRTELAFYNSSMSIKQTHLSYLRTIVTLIGTGATIFKALPALGVSATFSTILSGFLLLWAVYFIYKDAVEYPKMKKYLQEVEEKTAELKQKAESEVYNISD